MQDWILYIIHQFLDLPSSNSFKSASKRYWELMWKNDSTMTVDISKRGGWSKERPDFFKPDDITRLVVCYELSCWDHDVRLEEIQRFHRLRKTLVKRLSTYWIPQHTRLQSIEMTFPETGWVAWSLGQTLSRRLSNEFQLESHNWDGDRTTLIWKRQICHAC